MDIAKNLIRSVTRAFYDTEHVLVVDAVLQHSAIRDDELALLLSSQTKATRKTCAKLKEDGLIAIHSQQEQREGQTRAFTRDYYFVDMHRAIDATKFRIKGMTSELERKYGQKVEDVKAFSCPQCKMQYTHFEILDAEVSIALGGFLCKRCGHKLDDIDQSAGGGTVRHTGHEMMSKLNRQLAPFEEMMRIIDASEVPENDWDYAIAHAIPINRDQKLNPGARSTIVDSRPIQQTVHGRRQEAEADNVVIEGEDTPEERARKEKERVRQKEEEAKKNALPVWYTDSTVGSTSQTTAVKTNLSAADLKKSTEEEDLKPEASTDEAQSTADDDALKAYYAAMEEAEDEEESSDDDEEEDDDDDDEDGDEEVEKSTTASGQTPSNAATTPASGGSPRKKVRMESPKKDAIAEALANGGQETSDDDSDD